MSFGCGATVAGDSTGLACIVAFGVTSSGRGVTSRPAGQTGATPLSTSALSCTTPPIFAGPAAPMTSAFVTPAFARRSLMSVARRAASAAFGWARATSHFVTSLCEIMTAAT